MKKLTAVFAALCLLMSGASAAEVESGAALRMAAVCDNARIEVGDQFLVRIMLDGDFDKYLTYSVSGSFDPELAELVAPVYKDDGFSIVYNKFSNDDGSFMFDAADIAKIEGCSDPLICSLLFRAKKAGSFAVALGEASASKNSLFLGRATPDGDKIDFDFTVTGFEAEIYDDSDSKDVVIIAEKENKTPFDDMYDHEWAQVAVGAMSRLGILDGIAEPNGSFMPDQAITRGEFAAMLVRGADLTREGDNFTDVPEDYPYAKELSIAKAAGIALGYENGGFSPDAPISRQDISVLVFRALNYLNKIKPADEAVLAEFPDKIEISGYAVPSMAAVVRAHLINGDEKGRLNPTKYMTRAEAAVLIESVMIHIKLVQ